MTQIAEVPNLGCIFYLQENIYCKIATN